jgi:hypothetical protein
MSELRSAIEALRSEPLEQQSDARLQDDFAEVQRAADMLEVERLRRLAEIERRRVFERDGYLNTTSWLSSTFKVGWGAAKEQVKAATALEEMPETRRALEDGQLSTSAARVLVAARDADPSAFELLRTAGGSSQDPFHAGLEEGGVLLAERGREATRT